MTKMHIAPPAHKPPERNRLVELATLVLTIGAGAAGAVVFIAAIAVAVSYL